MKIYRWLGEESLKKKNLYYKLHLIFGLFFLFPVFGFIYFAHKYDVLDDQFVPIFFMGMLVFSLFGFIILKTLFDKIVDISSKISKTLACETGGLQTKAGADEMQNIVESFSLLEKQFSSTFSKLEKKASEISILKELSELCYVTFDPEEILYVTLERALMLTGSDVGSVMTIDRRDRNAFVVKASVGLGQYVKLGDRIDFETSIAKYAVINKSPLVVKDVEKDRRFGRANLPQYGTKSFVCMPIKTSKEIIGVLSLSRKEDQRVYTQDDIEALTPLLSNAAFTYENLRLIKENQRGSMQLRSIEKIFKVINSSYRDSELIQAVLNEIHMVIPFEVALLLTRNGDSSDHLGVYDMLAFGETAITKGARYATGGTLIDKVMKQQATTVIDAEKLPESESAEPGGSSELEKELIGNHGRRSCLLAPLRTDGQVTGVLALSAASPDIFEGMGKLMDWIANGLSVAIDRNHLSDAVLKRNRELESIRQIGSALASSTFDIKKVLKYTMDMIRVLMNVEAGSLLFLKQQDLDLAVAFNTRLDTMKRFRLKIGQGIAGYVASRGEALIVNDVQRSPHFFAGVDRITGYETRSALCVPMISQGKVIGVIEVLNKIAGDFTSNDQDLLQSIAASVSIAIENGRLYRETVSMAEHERSVRRMFQKFVPKEVLESIIQGEANGKIMKDEIKTVTLLNIDIRGFTELAMEMGPQKTVSLLNNFFSVMGGIVFKHNGIVDKYLGDGFLAIFGAPINSERDADNAALAALEMQSAIGEVNRSFQSELGISLHIGISVHTGDVVVGNIGFDKKMDYTVIGDAVNTVFRLQELAKSYPNGIIVGEKTCRAAQSRLRVRDLKNALGELKLYELMGIESAKPQKITAPAGTIRRVK
ncbi:MAG TPA: GAF domain-containing protein [Desulfobacterales bacterium]